MTQRTVSSITGREVMTNILMASLFSSIFFYLPFRGMEVIKLGVGQKFPIDFFPQAFFLGFFCSFIPQVMTSKAINKGALIGRAIPMKRILLRSFMFGIAFLALLGTAAFFIAQSFEGLSLNFTQAWGLKIIFAIVIAIVITPFALRPLREL